MKQYLELVEKALNGRTKYNRTGVDTIGFFGHQMRFDISENDFPLLTTKKVFTRGIFEELKWFIRGETNIKTLVEKDVHIWDSWATDDGEVGPMYGKIWRSFPVGLTANDLNKVISESPNIDTALNKIKSLLSDEKLHSIDQLKELLVNLQENPYSRRHIISAWAPALLPNEKVSPQDNVRNGKQALAACHTFFQLHVEELTSQEAIEITKKRYNKLFKDVYFDINKIKYNLSLNISKEKSILFEEDIKVLENKLIAIKEEEKEITLRLIRGGKINRLSMQLYQRSMDIPLGCPFNIASYAALLELIAKKCGMIPGDFIHTVGDAHIYIDQVDLIEEQIQRTPRPLPSLWITGVKTKNDWSDINDVEFSIHGYDPHPAIKFPSAAV